MNKAPHTGKIYQEDPLQISNAGTANNGTDYTSESTSSGDGYVTFLANTTSASVTVETLTDSDDTEGDEYFSVKIHSRQTRGALTDVQGWTSSSEVGFDPNKVPAEKTVTIKLYDDTTSGGMSAGSQ